MLYHRTVDVQSTIDREAPAQPLTALSEEERFFQTTVRQFAREQIRPYVREMDETCAFRKDIIRQFFEMGLMGIEIPEEYGGQGGSFFQSILAVWRELSAVDPAAGVIVDVQNTICNNALRFAGPLRSKSPNTCPASPAEHRRLVCTFRGRIGIGRLRGWRPARKITATTFSSLAANSGLPNAAEAGFFLLFR